MDNAYNHEELLKIYDLDKTFLDYFANDLNDNNVWYNSSEFARFHNVNGKKLLSILSTNTINQQTRINISPDNDSLGMNNAEGVLFCRAQEISGVKAEQIITLDGKTYQIMKASLLQDQVWRLELIRVQE